MRTRVIASAAVVLVSAIAPTAVDAAGSVAPGFPGVDVALRILLPEPEAEPVEHAHVDAHESEAVPAPQMPDVPAAPELPDVDPADLVRVSVAYRIGADVPDFDLSELGGPCPTASTCDVHALRDFRWPADETGQVVIPFAYNDENRRELRSPSLPTVRSALSGAMAEWSSWNSNIVFEDQGSTDATFGATGEDGTCADGTNVVGWDRLDNSVIGVASMCLDRTNSVLRDVDLALNANHNWQQIGVEDDRRQAFDVQSIYTHELGHWLSLVDLYIAMDGAKQTMFGAADPDQTHLRTLALGDITGVQAAYPCGPEDTCPREGIVDD